MLLCRFSKEDILSFYIWISFWLNDEKFGKIFYILCLSSLPPKEHWTNFPISHKINCFSYYFLICNQTDTEILFSLRNIINAMYISYFYFSFLKYKNQNETLNLSHLKLSYSINNVKIVFFITLHPGISMLVAISQMLLCVFSEIHAIILHCDQINATKSLKH